MGSLPSPAHTSWTSRSQHGSNASSSAQENAAVLNPHNASCHGAQNVTNTTDLKMQEAFLEAHNLQYFSSLAPTVGYLLGLAACGLAGNALVFVVYLQRLKSFPMRTYILAMSVCDLLTNCLSLPMGVLEIRFHVDFFADWLCRVAWTVISWLVVLSGFLLTAVAFDRQTLVCQKTPAGPFRFLRERKFVIACVVISLIISAPWLWLIELKTVVFEDTGFKSAKCAYVKGSVMLLVMSHVHNGLFVLGLGVLCFAYGRIARHLWQHRKKKTNTSKAAVSSVCMRSALNGFNIETEPTCLSQKRDSVESQATQEDTPMDDSLDQANTVSRVTEGSPNTGTLTLNDTQTSTEDKAPSLCPQAIFSLCFSKRKRHANCCPKWRGGNATNGEATTREGRGGKRRIRNRTTLMLFALTVIFVLNYMPHLLMVVLRSKRSQEWIIETLGPNPYYIMMRSLYVNSAVNPFVYGIFSPCFRQECRNLLQGLMAKLAALRRVYPAQH